MQHYRRLLWWMLPLAVPTALQIALLRTNWFRSEWMPALFTALCFIYLLAWRHYFRAACLLRDGLWRVLHASHPMLARSAIVAMLGGVLLSAAFLGISALTGTGPYDRPVIWLVFFVWVVCYKDVIMAVAMTAARENAPAPPPARILSDGRADRG